MDILQALTLSAGGLVAGLLAGVLGIGGGTVLVPFLVMLGYAPVQGVGTSSLAILVTASSGTLQNWRMGYLSPAKVIYLGLPAILTAQLGALIATRLSPPWLLTGFGLLLLVNVYLVEWRRRWSERAASLPTATVPRDRAVLSRLGAGGIAGLLAGLFGIGGGVILVPLQIWLLAESLKQAIQTSLGVIVITALSATAAHAWAGNVLPLEGLLLGLGGLLGAQFSTRFLPKLPDRLVSLLFRTFLLLLALQVFWQAWQAFTQADPQVRLTLLGSALWF